MTQQTSFLDKTLDFGKFSENKIRIVQYENGRLKKSVICNSCRVSIMNFYEIMLFNLAHYTLGSTFEFVSVMHSKVAHKHYSHDIL